MIVLLNIIFSFIFHNIPNFYYKSSNYKSCNYKSEIYNNLQTYQIDNDDNNNTNLFIKEITNNKRLLPKKYMFKNPRNFFKNPRNFFKTKVYIHLEQLFYKTNIYHIGITFKRNIRSIRYDIRGYEITPIGFLTNENNVKKNYKKIFWGYSNKSLNEIIEYEKNIDINYILGINDCRHYVNNLTSWCMNNGTPIWGLYKYF